MSMASNAYKAHNNTELQAAKLIISGFTGSLKGWWDSYVTQEENFIILNAKKTIIKTENNQQVESQIDDMVNTLLYAILKNFVRNPAAYQERNSAILLNLTCKKLQDFRWYKDVFLAKVMTRPDYKEAYWKERFIAGLPKLFAERIRNKLSNEYNGMIPYKELTYGEIINPVNQEGLAICSDLKLKAKIKKEGINKSKLQKWSLWFGKIAYLIVTTSRYVVPTSRVKVPAGRYVVPTGKDNVIVSAGRTKVIPAGRTILVLSFVREPLLKKVYYSHSQNFTMTSPIPPPFSMPSPSQTFSFPSTSEPVFSVSTSEPVFESPNSQTSQNTQSQQQFQQYHTTTVSNNNAKFPYLKKDEYETWAMKMEYWIMNSDHNLWNIVLNGNSRKKTGRDPKGNIMILPPVSVEEHIAVQRETKARTILLQSLPEDHMADFHHLDDARDIWLAVKARFGGNDESKKM
ncbi:hypothetical protein Tco_0684993, partial [Tanacetum coccineum]